MSLVTIQRSPTPSLTVNDSASDCGICSPDGPGAAQGRGLSCGSQCQSECYFAVKGAAVILARNECAMQHRKTCTADEPGGTAAATGGGGAEIQRHLQSMLQLLRVCDTLKMAVRLSSLFANHTRYLAIVSSCGRQDNEESIVVGIDYAAPDTPTIGLVLPLWAITSVALDGDGGICIDSDISQHVFKPISVQAMWSVYQTLHKVLAVARIYPYYPGGWTHTWVQYYESQVASPEPFRNEWHTVCYEESDMRNSAYGRFRQKPAERQAAEQIICDALKDIMQSVDLDEVTSKDIRNKLEERLELDLKEYKEFIDQEMLVILGQMDKPSQVFPYLYLGTEWNASNWEELRQNNVGFILNVTKEVDNFFPGLFHYLKIRVSDEESAELLKYWEITYKFISKAKEINSAVLVHCKKGISRSSSTVIAFAMKEYGCPLGEALQYVKEKRNCITPNKGFMEQLKIYEGILDASRNRSNLLWNCSLRVPKPLPEGTEDRRPCGEHIANGSVVYSCKETTGSVQCLNSAGMLVASENILKSGPREQLSPAVSVAEEPVEDFAQEIGRVGLVVHPDQQKVDTVCCCPKPPLICSLAINSKPEQGTVVSSSRYSVRRRLKHLEQRIQDQGLTLKTVQDMMMNCKRRSSSSSSMANPDSVSSSSGDESDLSAGSAANAKGRRNSKSSSSDSAVTDLTMSSDGCCDSREQSTPPLDLSAPQSYCNQSNESMEMSCHRSLSDRMMGSSQCQVRTMEHRRSAEEMRCANVSSGQVKRALEIYEAGLPKETTESSGRQEQRKFGSGKKALAKFWEGVFQKTDVNVLVSKVPVNRRKQLLKGATTKWHCDLSCSNEDHMAWSEESPQFQRAQNAAGYFSPDSFESVKRNASAVELCHKSPLDDGASSRFSVDNLVRSMVSMFEVARDPSTAVLVHRPTFYISDQDVSSIQNASPKPSSATYHSSSSSFASKATHEVAPNEPSGRPALDCTRLIVPPLPFYRRLTQ